jgi:hypothetical protein
VDIRSDVKPAAASVRHPNVASVFHLGRTGQNYFYAMEFVEAETLENLIKLSGRLEVKLAVEIATQATAGLSTLINAIGQKTALSGKLGPASPIVSSRSSRLFDASCLLW